MNTNDINEKLNAIFREVCQIDASQEIHDDWVPGNPGEWDSMANLALIGELEKNLNISLEFDELLEVGNWGELKKLVSGKVEK
jgi:acyl carrier protein